MSRKNYGKFAKMVTLGLLLGAGCGYSTGVSAAGEKFLEGVTLTKGISGDAIYVTAGKYGGTDIGEKTPLDTYLSDEDFAGFRKVDGGGDAITLKGVYPFSLQNSNVDGNILFGDRGVDLVLTDMPVHGRINMDYSCNLTINGTGTVGTETYSVKADGVDASDIYAINGLEGIVTLNEAIVQAEKNVDENSFSSGIFNAGGVSMIGSKINVNVGTAVVTNKNCAGIFIVNGDVCLDDSTIEAIASGNPSDVSGIRSVKGNVELSNSVIVSNLWGIRLVEKQSGAAGNVTLRGIKEYDTDKEATVVATGNGIYGVEGNVTLGGLTGYNSSSGRGAAGTVSEVIDQGDLKNVMDEYYAGVTDGIYKDLMAKVKDELKENSVVVYSSEGAAVKDVKGNVEIYGVREGDAAYYTYSTKLKGEEGIISSGGDVGVYGAEINAHGSGIEGAGNVTLMKSQLVNWEGYSIRDTKGKVTVVDSNIESNDMSGGAGISVVQGDVSITGSKIVSNYQKGIEYVGYTSETALLAKAVNLTVTDSDVGGYNGAVAYVTGSVILDGAVLSSNKYGSWTIENVGSEKVDGKYGSVFVGGGTEVVDENTGSKGDAPHNGGLIQKVYGSVVVDGTTGASDNKLVSNFGSGIKEVGISQNDDGSWGGVKILNGAHVGTYQDSITNVKGGVVIDGVGTLVRSEWGGVWTINTIGSEKDGAGNYSGVTVSGGAKVQDKCEYGTVFNGGAISNVYGGVVVTGSGTEVSSVQGIGIKDVGISKNDDGSWGGVKILNGAHVKTYQDSITNVKGDVVVDGGTEGAAVTDYANSKTKVTSETGMAISDVTGRLDVVRGVAISAKGHAIYNVGKDVVIEHSQISSTDAYAVNKVGGSVAVSNGSELKGKGIYDVTGGVLVTNSNIDASEVQNDNGNGIAKVFGVQETTADGDMGVTVAGLAADKRATVKAYGNAITNVEHGVRAQYADITSVTGIAIQNVGDEDGTADATGNTKGNLWLDNVTVAGYNSGIDIVIGNVTLKDSIVVATNGMGIHDVGKNVNIDGYNTANVKYNDVDAPVTASVFAEGDVINNIGGDVNANGATLLSSNGYGINKVNGDVNLSAVDLLAEKSAIIYVGGNVIVTGSNITGSTGNGIEKVEGNVVVAGSTIKSNTGYGVYVDNVPANRAEAYIIDSTIESGNTAVSISNRDKVGIENSELTSNSANALYLKDVDDAVVTVGENRNIFKAENVGIVAENSNLKISGEGTLDIKVVYDAAVAETGEPKYGGIVVLDDGKVISSTNTNIYVSSNSDSITYATLGIYADNYEAVVDLQDVTDIVVNAKKKAVGIKAVMGSKVDVAFNGSTLKVTSQEADAYGVEVADGGTVVIEDADGKVLDMEVKGQNAAVVYSYGSVDENNVSIANANVIVEATAEGGYQKLLKVDAGTINLTLDNVTVMGAPKAEGGAIAGSESLPDVTATDVEVLDGAVANIKLNNHSSFNGKVEANGTGVINMSLDNTSTWGVTETCKVNKLLNYGLVDMTVDNKYGTGLTVDELTGNGKIAMDVDFEAVDDVTRTDTVKVGSVADDIRINVLPRFKNLLTGEAVLIFTGEGVDKLNSSNVTFNGENINGANKIDYGAFSYSAAFEEGWLTMLPDWKGTDVVLSAKGNAALSAVIDPETWYQDTEALFDNMDEFAADRAKQQIWAKYTNKKNTYDESFKGAVNCDVDKKYNGVVVGWDNRAKHFEKANADLYVGAMLTYGSGRYNWNDGSNDLDGKGVGLYTVYKTAKGAYVGATMKYNKYKFDEIKGNQHDGFNTPFKGDYGSNAYGIDLAAGRRYAKDLEDGFYVEPQIGLGYVRYNNGSYDLNAMDVDVNGMTSLRGRFGVQFGTHKQTGKGGFYDIFARVTLNREFKGKDDVKLDRAYNFEVDQSGTWVNFAIGTRVGNMNKFNVDLSANLSRGKHESKVGVKAGLNFMF